MAARQSIFASAADRWEPFLLPKRQRLGRLTWPDWLQSPTFLTDNNFLIEFSTMREMRESIVTWTVFVNILLQWLNFGAIKPNEKKCLAVWTEYLWFSYNLAVNNNKVLTTWAQFERIAYGLSIIQMDCCMPHGLRLKSRVRHPSNRPPPDVRGEIGTLFEQLSISSWEKSVPHWREARDREREGPKIAVNCFQWSHWTHW